MQEIEAQFVSLRSRVGGLSRQLWQEAEAGKEENRLRAIGTGMMSVAEFVEQMEMVGYAKAMELDSLEAFNKKAEPLSPNERKARYRKGMNSFLNKGKRYRNA